MTNLVLLILRIYVSTNFVPGWVGGPPPVLTTNKDGYLSALSAYAVAITHPPSNVVVTNYVIGYRVGTNEFELLTLEKK